MLEEEQVVDGIQLQLVAVLVEVATQQLVEEQMAQQILAVAVALKLD
jgi:hypothetical protein